ncbi:MULTISPECIES: bifunctional phosphoribosylaminoimidazolecarboxamide formyltransferase/IMP cyclohydrolase [unclassified Corynebacterium]|uniref:bifunctional phosphoribosylaminoimidazolecarboxamide formyltransferase/IMP cyclohydrolase n=1 Tax=unclassified Corynebacterium TaxID=2624378 RepID=UPI00264C5B71|nr:MULTISPECIES: bifunctional phosphoribosylaminoimidazolecarboxamide formyltransferase/IMP cyclohydrolase [unclassified Corynebacterium]MDN8595258.1 bifunctional phosphoribosylaminoimidazolecarboxamide formyltransferase/IMP cyclohydrolase [Corynebacterium sp. P4_F2]WKK56514.1 bifunctional phosphoribosylaminoimidazolecarboxamide formyltransferase/IMP cyclohydrolase [Corynebacterium sp. P4-C1]WKK63949.1 bifunctional phosphoribosylaminoimidazolecarboxamide formyltransferase/IMP cyclohydrolase [Cor
MSTRTPIKRALISVYDKTGIEELASALSEAGVEIVSTGSTAQRIKDTGANVTEVAELTGFPEVLEGRVKTLHPRVHAGILADLRKDDHAKQIEELGVKPFELVVVNLYPFSETVASGASFDEVVEMIDIGGPSMVRAAAKNHPSVAVVVDPAKYGEVAEAVKNGGFDEEQRRQLAADAFAHTAQYDAAVSTWFDEQLGSSTTLRYGENPHQSASLISDGTGLAGATQHGGKEMSYNNYQDADAAWRACWDHERPCVAVIKHANPCGIAVSDTSIADAHAKAHACDPVSAYGGVIAANREVTLEMAEQVKPIFTEVIIAPSIADDALELLQTKKNLRILTAEKPEREGKEIKHISGGTLIQDRDIYQAEGDNPENWTLAAGEAADEKTLADLKFAWNAIRCVKSNAILIARDGAAVGVGMGQVNRVDSAKLAVDRANTLDEGRNRTNGAVAASDAFFPFADGFQILADAGVSAVVQPGGSIRDEEVVAAANEAGVTMYFTGMRHFSH